MDASSQTITAVNCSMKKTDTTFIRQMVSVAAALSAEDDPALHFTPEQTASWIGVCTQAIQRGKEDPYLLGAYELYILSDGDDVGMYAILRPASVGTPSDGAAVDASLSGEDMPLAGAEASYAALTVGDTGERVLALKRRLFELGYFASANYSGSYNSVTAKRVKLFQKANGLAETGVATADTLAVLYSEGAVKNPNSLTD